MRLIILFLLISTIAQGQSTYYIRADSTRLEKVGDGNELILLNDTRTRTGAYLRNRTNGRTDFYYAGDSLSISGSNLTMWRGLGTQNITVAVPSGFSNVPPIYGDYILNWQTTPRTISGVTVAFSSPDSLYSGTGTIVASGNYRTTASNEWEHEIIFSPTSTVSGTVAINITSTQSLQPNACIGSINLATGLITITNGGSTWTQTVSATVPSEDDVIRLRVIFYHNTLKLLYENITKNEVKVLNQTRAFGYLAGAGLNLLGHTSGTPGITFTSVTSIKVLDWKFKDNTRGQVAWPGQSILEGYAATAWANTYAYKVDSASYWRVALYAKAGMSIKDLVTNKTIDNIILSNPSVVVLDGLWYNDGLSETLANTWTRLTLIRKRLAAHNIPVIWLGPSINSAFGNSINDSIQTHYPNDPFFNLKNYLSGSWASADGVHPNDVGHQQIADSLIANLPFIIGVRVGSPNKVDTIWRTAGVDSIYFKIEGTEYAIKDSVGTGGGGTVYPGVPGFRLTTESGVPISTTDRTAQSTIYYTPYVNNQITLYTGAAWEVVQSAQISLALSGLTSGKNYDVFAYNNAGTLTLELSAAWTNDNTRADALAYQDGVLVKSGTTTRRYVGTIRTTGTTTTEDSEGGTVSQTGGKRFVWNMYNRTSRSMKVFDATDSWSYTTATWRQANGASGNQVEYVTGEAGLFMDAVNNNSIYNVGSGSGNAYVGIGISSTTVTSGFFGAVWGNAGTTPSTAKYSGTPGLGYFFITMMERGSGGTSTFVGDNGEAFPLGGLTVTIQN